MVDAAFIGWCPFVRLKTSTDNLKTYTQVYNCRKGSVRSNRLDVRWVIRTFSGCKNSSTISSAHRRLSACLYLLLAVCFGSEVDLIPMTDKVWFAFLSGNLASRDSRQCDLTLGAFQPGGVVARIGVFQRFAQIDALGRQRVEVAHEHFTDEAGIIGLAFERARGVAHHFGAVHAGMSVEGDDFGDHLASPVRCASRLSRQNSVASLQYLRRFTGLAPPCGVNLCQPKNSDTGDENGEPDPLD
jgi:hypothetical protein